MQCAGNISDVEAAFRRIKQKFASNPLYAVGISLGSCILGNYVISKGSKCGLKGMSLVSVPYEAYTLSKIMDRQLFNIYHWGLGFSLVQQMKEHKNELKSLESMLGLSIEACTRKIKTLRDFDNVVTSKVYGYKTTDSYYRSISLASKLGAITIPCFLLSPLDDPIIP